MVEREIQIVEEIAVNSLAAETDALKLDNWRLVQVLCVSLADGYELSYSFGGGYAMRTLRIKAGLKEPVPSITPYYPAAFLYENEIRDLFGARIERIDPDWNGKVLDVEGKKPFAKASVPLAGSERPPSAARASAPGALPGPAAAGGEGAEP
jgi:ech hydrogenase subunit D